MARVLDQSLPAELRRRRGEEGDEGSFPHAPCPSLSPSHFSIPPSPTTILFLSLPLEGKTKGLGEVTGTAGEREGKSEKQRKGEEGGKREREREK
jgi:hypothetical protein